MCVVCCVCACGVECVCGLLLVPSVKLSFVSLRARFCAFVFDMKCLAAAFVNYCGMICECICVFCFVCDVLLAFV